MPLWGSFFPSMKSRCCMDNYKMTELKVLLKARSTQRNIDVGATYVQCLSLEIKFRYAFMWKFLLSLFRIWYYVQLAHLSYSQTQRSLTTPPLSTWGEMETKFSKGPEENCLSGTLHKDISAIQSTGMKFSIHSPAYADGS